MRLTFLVSFCALLFAAGCASQPPSAAAVAALQAEFVAPRYVVTDSDCIFSAPVQDRYVAYRLFGLCLFSDTQLRLYYGGKRPALAFAWPIGAIKAYALHTDTFTLVTDDGNFGLVVKDATRLIDALRAQGVPEKPTLPIFRAKDPAPFNWM